MKTYHIDELVTIAKQIDDNRNGSLSKVFNFGITDGEYTCYISVMYVMNLRWVAVSYNQYRESYRITVLGECWEARVLNVLKKEFGVCTRMYKPMERHTPNPGPAMRRYNVTGGDSDNEYVIKQMYNHLFVEGNEVFDTYCFLMYIGNKDHHFNVKFTKKEYVNDYKNVFVEVEGKVYGKTVYFNYETFFTKRDTEEKLVYGSMNFILNLMIDMRFYIEDGISK